MCFTDNINVTALENEFIMMTDVIDVSRGFAEQHRNTLFKKMCNPSLYVNTSLLNHTDFIFDIEWQQYTLDDRKFTEERLTQLIKQIWGKIKIV